MDAMVGELRVAFSSHADQGKAFAMSTYMKGHFPFHGLQKPLRSELQQSFLSQAKALPIEKCHLLVQELWAQPEREYQYVAMDLLLAVKKKWNEETFSLAEKLIVTKSWWDTVDLLAARVIGGISQMDPEKYKSKILAFAGSENLWLNRTALIHQLFFKKKTDTPLFEKCFQRCGHKQEFFIQKAIGWALRQYAATDPAWVIRFVNEKALKGLAKREAIRKLSA